MLLRKVRKTRLADIEVALPVFIGIGSVEIDCSPAKIAHFRPRIIMRNFSQPMFVEASVFCARRFSATRTKKD